MNATNYLNLCTKHLLTILIMHNKTALCKLHVPEQFPLTIHKNLISMQPGQFCSKIPQGSGWAAEAFHPGS